MVVNIDSSVSTNALATKIVQEEEEEVKEKPVVKVEKKVETKLTAEVNPWAQAGDLFSDKPKPQKKSAPPK